MKTHIFDILDSNLISYDIYLHTYTIDTPYVNNYSNEINVSLDFEEYKILNPKNYQIDNQNSIKSQLKLLEYRMQ